MSTAVVASGQWLPLPQSAGASERDIARIHKLALTLVVAAVGTLPFLHPSGPGNSSPTDLLMLPAILAVGMWIVVSRVRVRAPFGIAISLVIVAGCISGVIGPYLRGALVTVGYPNAPLIAVVQDVYLILWCLALVNLMRSATDLKVVMGAWVYAAVFWAGLMIIGVFTGIDALSGIEVGNGVRAEGQFGDPNLASGYYAMSLFVLWAGNVPRQIWLRVALAGVLLLAMALTGSNGGVLSLAAGVTFVAVIALRRHFGVIVAVGTICALLLVGAAATKVVNPTDIQQWARDSGVPILRDWIGRSDSSASQRVVILQEAWVMFQKAGPLGAGPGATQPILVDSLAPFPHQAHDDYVAAVVERGVEGGIAMIILICAIVWRARGSLAGKLKADFAAVVPRREPLVGALVGMAVAAAYYQVLHFRHLWLLLAVIAAVQIWGREWSTKRAS